MTSSKPSKEDEKWMGLALSEARLALAHADVPIGAVVVDSTGDVLARAHNERERLGDPTAHAEVVALRAACARRSHWRLEDCTLYVTLEPCCMCAGALVNARIGRLVYGAHDKKAGAVESLFHLNDDGRLNHRFRATGGVLEQQCSAELQKFFRGLRAEGQK